MYTVMLGLLTSCMVAIVASALVALDSGPAPFTAVTPCTVVVHGALAAGSCRDWRNHTWRNANGGPTGSRDWRSAKRLQGMPTSRLLLPTQIPEVFPP